MITGMFFCLFCISGSTTLNAAEPVSVFVSIMPQKYFVEKIGGNLVDVSVMVKPGVSPATYEPKPKQICGKIAGWLLCVSHHRTTAVRTRFIEKHRWTLKI